MKALSLWQPWAQLLVSGQKAIETRSWATGYRGLVLIHAAKMWGHDEQVEALRNPFINRAIEQESEMPLGAFVGVVTLVGCARIAEQPSFGTIHLMNQRMSDEIRHRYERRLLETEEEHFGNYADGRYAWLFDEPRRLPAAVPAKGAQGLWTPTPEQIRLVSEQIPGLTALSPQVASHAR
jgi:hypothetical protein